MPFHKQILLTCPACGQSAIRVTETRKTSTSTRRRKHCDACGHGVTTHEIAQEAFQLAQTNATLVNRFRKLLGTTSPEYAIPLCPTCKYNESDHCTFSFPEYGTPNSADCNLYAAALK